MSKPFRKVIKRILFPFLKPYFNFYLSKKRAYRYHGIKVMINPGVFHPGFFLSTKVFINFLKNIPLKGKRILELGAGSGLISIFCAKKGAVVTASDINSVALDGIKENMEYNEVTLEVIKSDLFDNLAVTDFDLILINPPYYPKDPNGMSENAWYCGSEFQYFEKLFKQLDDSVSTLPTIYMILSEDCQIEAILSIANRNNLTFELKLSKEVFFEESLIYLIRR